MLVTASPDSCAAVNMVIGLLLTLPAMTYALFGVEPAPSYTNSVRHCDKSAQCTGENEVCWRFYNGCPRGECICDPRSHYLDSKGNCRRIKLGLDSCGAGDRCPEAMSCLKGTCSCVKGSMTDDRRFCLRSHERLLSDICTPHTDVCYQLSAMHGYTSQEVECSSRDYTCRCTEGFKEDMGECRKWNIGEAGCTRDHHCQGGALCIDGTCRCPTGYRSVSQDSKCAKETAMVNLGIGASCDEIEERRYCSLDLVCHKCTGEERYTCVKFLESRTAKYIADKMASPHTSASLILTALTCLLAICLQAAT